MRFLESKLVAVFLVYAFIGEAGGGPLRVELADATGLGDTCLQGITAEASRIFEHGGISLEWEYSGSTARGAGDSLVFLLDELPKVLNDRFRRASNLTRVMGYVLAEPGGPPGSVVYVSRTAVEAMATGDAGPLTSDELTRALGRVVAHELAHRFLRTGHTAEGILKESFSRRDLTAKDAPQLRFTARQAESLRSSARRLSSDPDSGDGRGENPSGARREAK